MALGGGTWAAQNKGLPGAYINFVSAAKADAKLSERGYVTMPLELDWGPDGQVFTVTAQQFRADALKIFGYSIIDDEMKGLRDLFLNAQTLHAYKLTSGGEKAACDLATARYGGTRGNALKVVVAKNADDEKLFDVTTYLNLSKQDLQTVASASELKDNDFLVWKKDVTLAVTAATNLSGGTDGTVDGDAYQAYLDAVESYSFNVMGIVTADSQTKALCRNFVKRLRDDVGAKFQLVLYNEPTADYEGVISVKNKTLDAGWSEASAVYWTAGAEASCAVNTSVTNRKYDGEFSIESEYTQIQLEQALQSGEFVFHRVGDDTRVLSDINTFVSFAEDKGEDFADNQTIRVIDQIANDDAVLFNTKYLGKVPNDAAGRISLWNDFVKARKLLQDIRAIENFTDADVTVAQGGTKKSVVVEQQIQPVNCMTQLYMTVTIA